MRKYILVCQIIFFSILFRNFESAAISLPYSTNDNNITIWNGESYVPFFIKGMNLGVSIPGTFPGELAATSEQYEKWFADIKNAGFNCLRLYTLHYPRFYEVLDAYNTANPHNPLLFFQGVWLNEELEGYDGNLYFLSDTFKVEIEENIDCVHGNREISHRYGKAYGTYTVDVSKWCLGYIIGREVYPSEILETDNLNSHTAFTGTFFSIDNASASEVWFTEKLNHLVAYENNNYNTQRPVSVSSWPTLDPLSHPEESFRDEDTASINLAKINADNAPAGMFISYHAYPYYPDFISSQSTYQYYSDYLGVNSYWAYLTDLKSHYPHYPLIIAEYGVPSSWGIAHFSSSGMNHGGFDDKEQGENNIRILQTIENTNCGGGMQFAWIDEWFKRTWITDELDYDSQARVRWHNITAAEQNFGLLGFKSDTMGVQETILPQNSSVHQMQLSADAAFFKLNIKLNNVFEIQDEMWICFDTYADDLGESILMTGDTIPYRSEFVLHVTKYSAQLYVTEAYDLFGRWHYVSTPQQEYKSTSTNGNPWNIIRWKNNSNYSDVQYIGDLQVNQNFQSLSSKDAVMFSDSVVDVKIPWTLLHITDPSSYKVCHDDKSTYWYEDTVTEGVKVALLYKSDWNTNNERFRWEGWTMPEYIEYYKPSYYIMQENLSLFNTNAIAVKDVYPISETETSLFVDAQNGVIKNDFDLDGNVLQAVLISNPQSGTVELEADGSFVYESNQEAILSDYFEYCLFDGHSLSNVSKVYVGYSESLSVAEGEMDKRYSIICSPNPSEKILTVESGNTIDDIMVFNTKGTMLMHQKVLARKVDINVSLLSEGQYYVTAKISGKYVGGLFVKR